ncbi:MAG: DUF502 domain-containing protein [Planctomycetota bacterium JB042]
MKTMTRLFLRGLAAILPLGATIYLLYWLGSKAERLLSPWLERILPDGWYVAGMGVAAGLVAVLFVGALMTTYVASWLLAQGENLVERIPVVKTVYTSLKDTVNLFADEDRERPNRPVLVEWGEPKTRILGFLTRESVTDVVDPGGDELVAVYLPLAYQIGGLTVMVPRRTVVDVDMTAEDALRFAVTAGMSGKK